VEVVLRVERDRRLVLRWRPYLNATRLQPPPFTETVLLRDVAGMELGFWRQDTGWSAVWDAADLPGLVRIRLTFPPPGRQRWPDIVAAPGLDRP
jgi:general secretion pathway protein J